MEVTRVQIEGGFLDGFDLTLSPGLNVIIGARGTGKTSVIELIRYGLDARNHTTESRNRSLDHARAVLDGGEVSITLADSTREVLVTRSVDDDEPRAAEGFLKPIVLSQTEIETLGLSESGRLNLLDGFIGRHSNISATEAASISSITSIYKDIGMLEAEVDGLQEAVKAQTAVQAKIKESEEQLAKLQGDSAAIAEKQARLNVLSNQISDLVVKHDVLSHFEEMVRSWAGSLDQLVSTDLGPDPWSGDALTDPVGDLRKVYMHTLGLLTSAADSFKKLEEQAKVRRGLLYRQRIECDKEARSLRVELEKLAEGTGALARQLATQRALLAQLQSRALLLKERHVRLEKLRELRDEHFEALLNIRSERFALRYEAANRISSALAPYIRVEVDPSAQYGEYIKAITNALRGSGMKYGDLTARLAEAVSPRELFEFVENGDFKSLSDIIEIPNDRAARLLGHLKESGMVDIVTCDIEDNVRMSLLDGMEYKDISALSAGQRCTVILSIVLQHKERTLIIDQPEDHLDNAFIANTVIKALKDRHEDGQVILSTHNANIPVLGEADLVVELTSDGKNGFVQVNAPLDDPEAVHAITSVMEGGIKAFQSRASFYEKHHL